MFREAKDMCDGNVDFLLQSICHNINLHNNLTVCISSNLNFTDAKQSIESAINYCKIIMHKLLMDIK